MSHPLQAVSWSSFSATRTQSFLWKSHKQWKDISEQPNSSHQCQLLIYCKTVLSTLSVCRCCMRPPTFSCSRSADRIAYDRLVADFEALECVRARQKERKADGTEKEPPDGALAAESAAERYLSAMPAAQQTRESVRQSDASLFTLRCMMPLRRSALCARVLLLGFD